MTTYKLKFNLEAFAVGVFTLTIITAIVYMIFGHGYICLASVLVGGQWIEYSLRQSHQPVISKV